MPLRFFKGNNAGVFKFRASKPGADALTDDVTALIIHENMMPMVPDVIGELGIGPATQANNNVTPGETTVNVGRTYAVLPFIVLKSSLNTLPGETTFFCRLNLNNGDLTLYNRYIGQSISVKYAIYAPI
jgi:hypothetical protein